MLRRNLVAFLWDLKHTVERKSQIREPPNKGSVSNAGIEEVVE